MWEWILANWKKIIVVTFKVIQYIKEVKKRYEEY
jgi:hypothetical protein